VFAMMLGAAFGRPAAGAVSATAGAFVSGTAGVGVSGTAGVGVSGTAGVGVSGTAKAVTKTARMNLSKGFDEKEPIYLDGERVHFDQAQETMLAEGDVTLVSAGTEVHADRLWYDMKQGTLRAEGGVVVADSDGNTLWAERLAMNQVSRTGEAEDIVYAQSPWTAACGGADILPDEVVVLHGCECTSCRQEDPVWRLSAKKIKIKGNEMLWAWGVWLYTGRMPVLYLPYFSRNLRDPRPPIELRPGYNSTLGAYVRTSYNYFLDPGNYGSLRYDWMANLGSGFGAGEHYKVPGGDGSVAGYYTVDKNDSSQDEYSAHLSHKQNLGNGLTLMGQADVLSNPAFNETFDIDQVDSYQQRSFLNLQSVQKTYTWNLEADQTTVQESIPNGIGGIASTQSVVSEELFPSFTFSHNTEPLKAGSPIYWGYSVVAQRQMVAPQVLQYVSGTAVSLYDSADNYFMDGVTFTPTITDTVRLTRRLSLSGNLNANLGWVMDEKTPPPVTELETMPGSTTPTVVTLQSVEMGHAGAILGGYGTFIDLQGRPRTGITLDFGHRYLRQLNPVAGMLWSGEETNQFEAKANFQIGEPLNLLASDTYDLRPYGTDSDLKRFGLVRLQSSYTPSSDHGASVTSTFHIPTGAFKTVDLTLTENDPKKKMWESSFGVDWVNNAIVATPPSVDPTAPSEFNYQDPRSLPDQLLGSGRFTLVLSPKWKVSYYEQLDLVDRRINAQAYTVDRDMGCVDLQLYSRQDTTMGWQYGFALSLTAVPGARLNSNDLTNDLFNPVQYGY
jgi:hypothetical protein